MMAPAILLAFLIQSPHTEGEGKPYSAYEAGFRAAYRVNAIKACVSSAVKSAEMGIDTTSICSCIADNLLATETIEELSQVPSKSKLVLLASKCVKSDPPQSQTSKPRTSE
jgi:hypothetical protein